MKKIAKFLGLVVGFVLLVALGYLAYARMHDGPLGLVAGGAFASGTWSTETDLGFARDLPTIEFQLLSPARSRTTWLVESNGKYYIPSGYMNGLLGTIWKHWPHEAEADGRVVVRIAGKRYARQLVRYPGGPDAGAVLAELNRKYGMQATEQTLASGDLWLFELQPRQADAAELSQD